MQKIGAIFNPGQIGQIRGRFDQLGITGKKIGQLFRRHIRQVGRKVLTCHRKYRRQRPVVWVAVFYHGRFFTMRSRESGDFDGIKTKPATTRPPAF